MARVCFLFLVLALICRSGFQIFIVPFSLCNGLQEVGLMASYWLSLGKWVLLLVRSTGYWVLISTSSRRRFIVMLQGLLWSLSGMGLDWDSGWRLGLNPGEYWRELSTRGRRETQKQEGRGRAYVSTIAPCLFGTSAIYI